MQNIRALFTGWHLMRWLRLAFGIFFLVQAFMVNDLLIGLAGAFFLFTSITNVGCCGSAGSSSSCKRR
jgi:hypothetical protein